MTYICHDTVKTASGLNAKSWIARIADWMQGFWAKPAGHQLDPRNHHLQRDIGVTVSDAPGIFKPDHLSSTLPYSTIGNNTAFIDLFLSEHLDRGPR